MISKKSIDFFAVTIGVCFLFFALNPFIFWIIWPGLINFPLFFCVVIVTLILLRLNWMEVSLNKVLFAVPIFLFMIHLGTPFFGGLKFDVGKLMSFTALLCVLFFNSSLHYKIFIAFRKLMLMFSWFAVLVFGFIFIGFELPYYKIPAFTLVMNNSFGGESFYKLYGLVVSSTNTVYQFGSFNIARICGPFQEPGHFAIYIGLIMLFEKIIFKKVSKIFLVAGILTFSPNFFIIIFIIFLYDLIYSESKKVLLLYGLGGLILLFLLFLINDNFREQLIFLTIGRNFENTDLALTSILDQRAGKQALAYYTNFLNSSEVYYGKGVENMEQFGVLSDWRGVIFKYGFIGLTLSSIACLRVVFFAKLKGVKIIVILMILLIYLQRSWMFESTFVYLFLIIGLISSQFYTKQPNERASKL